MDGKMHNIIFMNVKSFSNRIKSIVFCLRILFCLTVSIFFLAGCQEYKASGEYRDPYSKEDVVKMMAYHGAIAARFDGKQWWCLSGKKWFKIENGGAAKLVQVSRQEPSQDNNPS
jgi:hypothetical protein